MTSSDRSIRRLALPRGDRGATRIEAFSDAVFAFAVTLLVVSLEVPRSFDDLLRTIEGFPAFGISFALLILIWGYHYAFFRRYDLADGVTVALNAALLFLVLFYVYPLKFLWTWLIGSLLGFETGIHIDSLREVRGLMVIYGAGFLAVFLLFFLLHLHAWRQRDALRLTPSEAFDARSSLGENAIMMGVAALSIGVVLIGGDPGLAGAAYFLLGPLAAFHGMFRRRRKAARGLIDEEPEGAP